VVSSSHISPHFSWSEAACHSGAVVPDDLQPNARRLALSVLEPLRSAFGAPIIPISWYRTPAYNKAVGGVVHSQHLYATAVDCRPPNIDDLSTFKNAIENMLLAGLLPELGGLGWYPGRWVHLDVRQRVPAGHLARWTGTGIGSEP
jgi:uncharacterized protein YcbK (DUF882 family)